MHIFMISELKINEQERHLSDAAKYEIIGFVTTKEEAMLHVAAAGILETDGSYSWPFGYLNGWPRMKYAWVERIKL